MDKIIISHKKGISLIELIIYISIFSIISIMITESLFYIQKIIQNNNQNYYIKNQIYNNLNILQQYLLSNRAEVVDEHISILDRNNNIIFEQILEDGEYKNIYNSRLQFKPMENIKIENIKIEFTEENRLIRYQISYKDQYQRVHDMTDYLIVINRNM